MSSIQEAIRVLDIEAQAILKLKDRLGADFEKAVDMLCQCCGKVIVAGMGKSGHIGRKIAATMSSTGTPALFLHPVESSHGDLGVVVEGDCLLIISYGGGSKELNDLLSFATRRGLPIIALTGNRDSQLAQVATVSLDVGVEQEACPLNLAPTSSSTASLAMGDALAMAALAKRGFKQEDFAEFHPGGKLGRRLLTRVSDIMHDYGSLPLVKKTDSMVSVVSRMTGSEVRGIAGVTDEAGLLVGVITDGDIRRHLEKNKNPFDAQVKDLMSSQPKTIDPNELAAKALFIMEQFSIQSLFVVNAKNQKPEGLIHLQDLIKAQIR